MASVCTRLRLPLASSLLHIRAAGAVAAPTSSAALHSSYKNIDSSLAALRISTPVQKSSNFSTSSCLQLKEIERRVEGHTTVVEGKYVESPNTNKLVSKELADKKVCPLCALDLNLKHTDVLVLSQFVRSDGRLLPRRVTGLCCSQQYKLTRLVLMAKKAGLMPNLAPANSHKDPAKRRGSKKLRRFFDDATIKDTRFLNVTRFRDVQFATTSK